MKKKTILLLIISIFCFTGLYSQIPEVKTLIANETYIVKSGNSSFRIITSNDTIAHVIMSGLEKDMSRFSYVMKKDRMGSYWERSYYFKNDKWNHIVNYLKNKRICK